MRVNGIPVEGLMMRDGKELTRSWWRRGQHHQPRLITRATKRVWAWARMWWMAVLYR